MLEIDQNSGSTYLLEVDRATSSQCYKRFTGLYLQVCENRPTLKVVCGHKRCLIQNDHAGLLKSLVFLSENRHHTLNLTTRGA